MIKVTPTTASGLKHTTYTFRLPAELDTHSPRSQKVANTLSGVPVVTLWAKTRIGATASVKATISRDQYKILKKVVYHKNVFEWLTITEDDTFVCSVDLVDSEKASRNGLKDWYDVTVAFVIIEEK